jgi:ADP-ribose pyrophosphatase
VTELKHDKPVGRSLGWLTVETTYLFTNKWLSLRQDRILRDEPKATKTYTYTEIPDSVFIVPILPNGNIVLIRSYRHTLDALCWEVPAGTLADRSDMSPEKVAIEELREEIGGTCSTLRLLGRFFLGNGHAHHRAHFFVAVDVDLGLPTEHDSDESIVEIKAFSSDEILQLIGTGQIDDGDSVLALLMTVFERNAAALDR